MLRRGLEAAAALENHGVHARALHKNVYAVSKADGFVVRIDVAGRPESLELRAGEEMSALFTWQDGNQNSFPSVKVHRIPPDEDEEKRKRREGAWERLKRISLERAEMLSSIDSMSALPEVLRRHGHCNDSHEAWVGRLIDLVEEKLDRGELGAKDKPVKALLGGRKCPVVFDLPPADLAHRVPVSDPRTGSLMSEALLRLGESDLEGVCDLSGQQGTLIQGAFPVVNMPVLGQPRLWSLDTGSRSNTRYGVIGGSAVRVSEEAAYRAQGSLQWLTHPERKQMTWSPLGVDTILLVYLPDAPEIRGPMAALLSDEGRELQWIEIASQVSKALRGHAAVRPESRVEVFALQKTGKSGARVNYLAAPSVEQILEASKTWRAGVKRVNHIWLPRKEARGVHRPVTPGVGSLVALTRSRWIRRAETKKSRFPWDTSRKRTMVSPVRNMGFQWTEAVDLFLHDRGLASALRIVISSAWELLWCLGALDHSGVIGTQEDTGIIEDADRRGAMRYVALLGILLERMRVTDMHVMRKVGELMAYADRLHREYCLVVREGSVPPSLIGAGLMRMASSAPLEAMSVLAERSLVYSAWADTHGNRRGRWALSEMGRLAEDIEASDLPKRPNAVERTELMLGYLSKKSYRKKKDEAGDSANSEGDDSDE